jgi:hypothetical protein
MFKTFVNASAGVSGPGGMQPVSAPSQQGGTGPGGWHPSVLYMLGLVAAEIIAVWYISKKL